jgi:hypothetical protein
MLVLSRKLGQSIVIDNEVVVTLAIIGREFVELSVSDWPRPNTRNSQSFSPRARELGIEPTSDWSSLAGTRAI